MLANNSTYTTSHPCRFGPFILRHDWVTGGTETHATHRSKRRNRGRTMAIAPLQRISLWRLTQTGTVEGPVVD